MEDRASGFLSMSEDLKLENKLLTSMIEKVPSALRFTDLKGAHVYHNQAFTDLFGYSIMEFVQKKPPLFYDESQFEEINKQLLHDSGASLTRVSVKDKIGRVLDIDLQIEPIEGEGDQILGHFWIFKDATEQLQIRRELKIQHEYLATLHSISIGMFRRIDLPDLLKAIIVRASKITGIPDGFLYLYDAEKKVLEAKAACGELISYIGVTAAPGKGAVGEVFVSGEALIINDYQSWKGRQHGSPFSGVSSVVLIPLVSGAMIEGVLGLSHHEAERTIDPDIIGILEEFSGIARIAIDNAKLFGRQKDEFERRIAIEKAHKQMETKLQQAQRLEAIGTLAGGIAHDFNNILSAILGFTQIALTEVEKDSQLEDDLNEIYKASMRARDLVRQILTFARQSDEGFSPIRVDLIVKEVLKFIRSSIPSSIRLEQYIHSKAKVVANPTQLYQVFLNLFTNSSQAMGHEGGLLQIQMDQVAIDQNIHGLCSGDYLKIEVSDTGSGIDAEHLEKIFEPYFTTKEKGEGTGLGLAVVHGAVKRMKGDIQVESTSGKGTVFTILLPISLDDIDIRTIPEEDLPMGHLETILFVDDEAPIAKLGRLMLESLNYNVVCHTDSRKALETFQSDPNRFDLVITDWTMPEIKGDELCLEIKKLKPDIPVLIYTGFEIPNFDDTLKHLETYFMKKPMIKYDLALVLKDILDKPAPE